MLVQTWEIKDTFLKYDTKSRFVKIVLTSENCKFKATHFDKGEFKYNNQPSLVFKKN